MKTSSLVWSLILVLAGASAALADVRSDSLNVDPRFMDDVDLIWFYPNLVTSYQNLLDGRVNTVNTNASWGGFINGDDPGLGVWGAYIFRPFGYDGTRSFNFGAPGSLGTGIGVNGSWQIGANNWTAPNGIYNGHFTPVTPENKLDLFWGSGGDKGSFGLQLNYADAEGNLNNTNFPLSGTNWDQNTSNNSAGAAYSATKSFGDSRVIGMNLGLGLQDLGFFNSADFHLGYSMGILDMEENDTPNTNTTRDNNSLKDNGIYTLSFGGLTRKALDDNSDLRVFAEVDLDQDNQTEHLAQDINNDGLHNDAGDIDEQFISKYNDIIATLGLGTNHKVLEGKATLSTGLQVLWTNDDTKLSASQQDGTAAAVTVVPQSFDDRTQDLWDLDWNAGVEGKISDWLTLRAGVNRPILWRVITVTTLNTYAGNTVLSTSKTTQTVDGYFGNSASTFSLGLGAKFENFQLDVRAGTSLFSTPGSGILYTPSVLAPVALLDSELRYQF